MFWQAITDSCADEWEVQYIEWHNPGVCLSPKTGAYRHGDRESIQIGPGDGVVWPAKWPVVVTLSNARSHFVDAIQYSDT